MPVRVRSLRDANVYRRGLGAAQDEALGQQWSIIANWLYIGTWACYVVLMSMDFDRRFGLSQFGVLGFWLEGGLPFLGPVVLLPYLHSVNKECWSE
jgi:hypothetical protein